jgi:hypothetical protein
MMSNQPEQTQMEALVLYLVKPLVSNPEEIVVTEVPGEDRAVVQVEVAASDVGRVIGRQGRVIQSLRTLLALASKSLNQPVSLELID